jgi:hypothetical protein
MRWSRQRVPSAPRGTVSGADNSNRALSAADPPAPVSTAEGRATTSSAEYIVGELRRHKRGVGLVLVVLRWLRRGHGATVQATQLH